MYVTDTGPIRNFITGKRSPILRPAGSGSSVSPPPPPAGPTIDYISTDGFDQLGAGIHSVPASGNWTGLLDGVTTYGPFDATNTAFDPASLTVGSHTVSVIGVAADGTTPTTLRSANTTFNFPIELDPPILTQTGDGEITVAWDLIGTNVGASVNLYRGVTKVDEQFNVGNSAVFTDLTSGNYTADAQGSSDTDGLLLGNISALSDPIVLLPTGPTIIDGVSTGTQGKDVVLAEINTLPASGAWQLFIDGVPQSPPVAGDTHYNGGDSVANLTVGNHTMYGIGVVSDVDTTQTTLPGANYPFNFPATLSAPSLAQTGANELTISWALTGTNAAAMYRYYFDGGPDPAGSALVVGSSIVLGELPLGTYTATVQGSSDVDGYFLGNVSALSAPLTLIPAGPAITGLLVVTNGDDLIVGYRDANTTVPASGAVTWTLFQNNGTTAIQTASPPVTGTPNDPITMTGLDPLAVPIAIATALKSRAFGTVSDVDATPTTSVGAAFNASAPAGPTITITNVTDTNFHWEVTANAPASGSMVLSAHLQSDDSQVDFDVFSGIILGSSGNWSDTRTPLNPGTAYYAEAVASNDGASEFYSKVGPHALFTTDP